MTENKDILSFIDQLHRNDTGAVVLIDVRSPGEFAQGHIPGAVNLPLLNDEERREVGITYKEHGQEAAVKKGFELVGHKFSDYIEQASVFSPDRIIHLYCWRGGLRSNIMAWLLNLSGFKVSLLKGGYKSYRNLCHDFFRNRKNLIILSGMTGTGKTEFLQELSNEGQQVIDLEALANHKGSAFGALGKEPQHTQEHFENLLGLRLLRCNEEPIWLEDESRFIGKLRIPDELFQNMLSAPHVELKLSLEKRVKRIAVEYGHFSKEILEEKTRSITKRMGGDQVKISIDALNENDIEGWIRPLLKYYDKTYLHGKSRDEAKTIAVIDLDTTTTKNVLQALKTIVVNV